MNLELQGRVVLITGGAQGIGAAIARACAAEQAIPVLVDRDIEATRRLQAELAGQGRQVGAILCDLTDPAACRAAVEQAASLQGRIDALVNNAGVNDRVGLELGNPDEFQQSLHRNLLHYYAMAHHALPHLRRAGGNILNLASKTALTGQGGTSGYVAAKGAILALTREWAVELLPYGLRVNAIVPAEVMTPLYQAWLAGFPDPAAQLAAISARIPLGRRLTQPEEIAAMAAFLISPRASHITGQHVFVDGGYVHLDRVAP